MSRKYRRAKPRKATPSDSLNREGNRQPREFSHKHRNNRAAIPRHEMIVEKKPPVPSFPTQQQDASKVGGFIMCCVCKNSASLTKV